MCRKHQHTHTHTQTKWILSHSWYIPAVNVQTFVLQICLNSVMQWQTFRQVWRSGFALSVMWNVWSERVCMRRIFPTVDRFIIAPASLFTPELGRWILSFSFFFFSVFFSTIQQALYQQHRQTLEWTLSAGSFPHCGHCSPPMDNGFPAQGGMLEMSVRKRAEQDVVSVGPLCSFSANLVKTTLGQQTRMHTPSLPHSTCLSY